MALPAPVQLGPFLVDTDGRLTPLSQTPVPAFSVRWRGRHVYAQLVRDDTNEHNAALRMRVTIGRVPSTVNAEQPEPRVLAFRLLKAFRAGLPEACEMKLLPDHRVMLEREAPIVLPATALGLVTELSMFLLRLAPYADIAEEAGMA